jgi:hypothetical protein
VGFGGHFAQKPTGEVNTKATLRFCSGRGKVAEERWAGGMSCAFRGCGLLAPLTVRTLDARTGEPEKDAVETGHASTMAEFVPWRRLWVAPIAFVVTECAIVAFARPLRSSWWLVFIGVFVYWLGVHAWLWSTLRRYAIFVTDTQVSGPTGSSGRMRTETIPLDRLDRTHSAERSVFERLAGGRGLYSLDGARINVERWMFSKADLRRLFALLEVATTESSPT